MSFVAMSWAIRQKLPCGQKMVLMMLADRHNSDTNQCNPSHDRLADDCGLTKRSVIDQISKLAEAGFVKIFHRSKDKLKLPNQYALVLSFGAKEVVNEVHYPSEAFALPQCTTFTRVVNHLHQGSEPFAHKPVIEPVIEPKEKKSAQAPSTFLLPDWINKEHWDAWHSCSKRKKATDPQKQMAVEKLGQWRGEGIDHAAALENAALAGWQGLFKPDEPKAAANTARAATESFSERDARTKREAWETMTNRKWPAQDLPKSLRDTAIDVEHSNVRRLAQ